jgi:hypothetical protein
MMREIGKTWALVGALWATGLAYFSATVFYQIGTFAQETSCERAADACECVSSSTPNPNGSDKFCNASLRLTGIVVNACIKLAGNRGNYHRYSC